MDRELPASPGKPSGDGSDSIGSRLRRRRRAKRMTLREVAQLTGLSEGYISQLERGRVTGSIASLQKLTRALGLNVGELFVETTDAAPAVLHASAARGYAFGVNARKLRLTPTSHQFLEAFLGEFEPGGSTGDAPYSHGDSEELLLVLEGEIETVIDGVTHRLSALDSITYSSRSPHKVTAVGERPARVLWAIAPPSY